MDISWPLVPGYGSLTCSGLYACSNLNYPTPDPDTALSIDCSDSRCMGSELICPANAACNIQCNKVGLCQGGVCIDRYLFF